MTDVVEPDPARPHVVERNLNLLRGFGPPNCVGGGRLRLAPEDEDAAAEILVGAGASGGDLLVGVHPVAGLAVREWGEERFAEVARRVAERYGAKVLWFSDPESRREAPALPGLVAVSLPFRRFMAVLARCQLFICNDSGPMHVAVGLGVPVVAVFGPQRPEWFGPWGEGHQVVIRHDIWCRPCADQCIWGEPHCLRLISVEQVLEAVEKALEAQRAPMVAAEPRL